MKRIILIIIVIAIMMFASRLSFGQQVQIIRMDGTVENVQIRAFDSTPKTIRIKPYGLNLKPANIPDRVHPYVPAYRPVSSPPLTIENPYFVPEREQDNSLKFAFRFIGALISEYHKATTVAAHD